MVWEAVKHLLPSAAAAIKFKALMAAFKFSSVDFFQKAKDLIQDVPVSCISALSHGRESSQLEQCTCLLRSNPD